MDSILPINFLRCGEAEINNGGLCIRINNKIGFTCIDKIARPFLNNSMFGVFEGLAMNAEAP